MESAAGGCADAGGRRSASCRATRDGREPYLTVAVATGMGEARNAIVRTADVVIAVRGEFGTLSEIALALKMGKPSWASARGSSARRRAWTRSCGPPTRGTRSQGGQARRPLTVDPASRAPSDLRSRPVTAKAG